MKLKKTLLASVLAISSASAYAHTCPPQYENGWVSPQFTNATEVLNSAIRTVDASLSTQLIFQSERLTSAIAVLTKQKALAASQIADSNRTTSQQVATSLGVMAQTERVKSARFNFGPEFGQGFAPCEVYATRSVIAARDADMDNEVRERVRTEIMAAPGRYGSRIDAAIQLNQDNQNSCTQDMVDAGLCQSVGSLPAASMSVATLFDFASEHDDVNQAKNTFINNLVGLPDEPIDQLSGVNRDAYMLLKSMRDASISPALATLKALQLEYTGVEGAETGSGLPMAQMFQDEVGRYVGDTQANQDWTKVMAAQNERGVLVELLKIKALDLAMQSRQLRQYERMEANLATLVAMEAQYNDSFGRDASEADETNAARNAVRRALSGD